MKKQARGAKKLMKANPKVDQGQAEEALRIVRALREDGHRSAPGYNLESPWSRRWLVRSKSMASGSRAPSRPSCRRR